MNIDVLRRIVWEGAYKTKKFLANVLDKTVKPKFDNPQELERTLEKVQNLYQAFREHVDILEENITIRAIYRETIATHIYYELIPQNTSLHYLEIIYEPESKQILNVDFGRLSTQYTQKFEELKHENRLDYFFFIIYIRNRANKLLRR